MLGRIKKSYKTRKKNFIEGRLAVFCSRSRFLSGLYYLMFSDAFAREHQAVLIGKIKHLEEARKLKANYYLLVRNTHRIEKGLLMRPRKPVFAKEYIGETVESFEGLWNTTDVDTNPQLKWFQDVLTEYFNASGPDVVVDKYKKRFTKVVNDFKPDLEALKSIPYYKHTVLNSNISYEEFYKLSRQRRSVRWFSDNPVSRELIDKAILAAIQAPSACNRQPFEFRIFDRAELVSEGVKLPMGTVGYAHSIPVFVVLVGNLDAYHEERDRHLIYIDTSLASMSFMYALETLGLASCPINWPDIEKREVAMEHFLKLEKHQRAIMCIGLGYPDPEGKIAFSEKRSLDKIRKYN